MSTQRKLSRAQKKAVRAAISKAKDKKELSAQDSIPYLQMRPDGICQVTPTHFTKTIQFRDINYQLSDNEDKQAIVNNSPYFFLVKLISNPVTTHIATHAKPVAALRKVHTHGTVHRHLGRFTDAYGNWGKLLRLFLLSSEIPRKIGGHCPPMSPSG